MKKKLTFVLILISICSTLCYAENFDSEKMMLREKKANELKMEQLRNKQQMQANEIKKIENNLYEEIMSCSSGKDMGLYKTLGLENGYCKFKTRNLVFIQGSVKNQVEYCSMPKHMYVSFVNDIRYLDETAFSKKWEPSFHKYCRTKIDDNW